MTWNRTKRSKPPKTEIWPGFEPKEKYRIAGEMLRKSPNNTSSLKKLERVQRKLMRAR